MGRFFLIYLWLFWEPIIYFLGRTIPHPPTLESNREFVSLFFPGRSCRVHERTIDMKRFTYAMVMAVALIVMVSSFAVAGGDKCKTSAKQAGMEECCIKAAKAGEGCHGKDADAVKASYASYKEGCADKAACEAAVADMGKCCVTAVEAGKGCCGKEADALKADYDKKVEAKAKKVATKDKESADS